MNTLKVLHDHQHEAEYDAAVWVDDHGRPRRIALFLAHHRVLRAAALVLATPVLAIIATSWAVREFGRVIDCTHEVGVDSHKLCPPCAKRDAKALKADGFTVEDFVGLCDLTELRGTEGGDPS